MPFLNYCLFFYARAAAKWYTLPSSRVVKYDTLPVELTAKGRQLFASANRFRTEKNLSTGFQRPSLQVF